MTRFSEGLSDATRQSTASPTEMRTADVWYGAARARLRHVRRSACNVFHSIL